MEPRSESIDFLNKNFNAIEAGPLPANDTEILKIEIDTGLEEALAQMEDIKQQLSEAECASLIVLCKNTVIETITGQFGLASLFLTAKDGGSVTTGHNFEKGITATEGDAAKYREYAAIRDSEIVGQDKHGKNIHAYAHTRKENYDPAHTKKIADYIPTDGIVVDAYTGREIPVAQANLDHVVSIKEIEMNAKAHLALSDVERANLACSNENYAITLERTNKSKGAKSIDDFLKTDTAKDQKVDLDSVDTCSSAANMVRFQCVWEWF